MECPDCKVEMDRVGSIDMNDSDCSCCSTVHKFYQCLKCKRIAIG